MTSRPTTSSSSAAASSAARWRPSWPRADGGSRVVERGEPGDEASGAAAGMLAPQAEAHRRDTLFDLALESRDLYPEWAAGLVEETGIDVGYRRTGLLRCVFGAPCVSERGFALPLAAAAGLRVEEWSDERVRSLLRRAPFAGSRGRRLLSRRGVVDPRRLTAPSGSRRARRGVRLLTGTAVRRFLVRGGVCRGRRDRGRTIVAGAVVDAAGAWAAFDSDLAPPPPVVPVRGQIVELCARGRAPDLGRVLRRGVPGAPAGRHRAAGLDRGAGRIPKGRHGEAVQRLIAAAVRLFPSLRRAVRDGVVRPASGHAGRAAGARRAPVPGLFFAAGHYRNGILLAPVTAMILSDLLTGGSGRDLSPFSIARFSGSLATV